MKQTAYLSYQFLIYLAMVLMLVPAKTSDVSTCTAKSITVKVQPAVAVLDKEEDIKNDLLFRY